MSKAVWAAFVHGNAVNFSCFVALAIRKEIRDKRVPGFKGILQTFYVVRLSIIKAGKRPQIFNYFFLGNLVTGFVNDADRLNKPYVWITIILDNFDKHNASKIPSYLLNIIQ